MKTLLLHIPQFRDTKREIMVLPMGLFSIADYLYKNDIDVKILHYGIEKELDKDFNITEFIKINRYRIICFDMHWLKQTKHTIEQIKIIKADIPDIIITAGGISATYFADEILKTTPEIDFLIRGEGEYPLLMLIKSLMSKKHFFTDIPNLSYRLNGIIRHNKVAFFTDAEFYKDISHSNFGLLINYKQYLKRLLYADFDTSTPLGIRDSYKNAFYYNPGKGCPYNCIYCGSHFYKTNYIKQKKGYYFFRLRKAIDDVCNSYNYGADTLRISFDPEPERKYYIKLFKSLPANLKKKIRLVFDCFSMPDTEFAGVIEETFREDSVIVLLSLI
ncbi:MAG: cobalamin-dependent protein, partial [Deltaproteobacteria bacterium]|nr:cobalamin-dependent protein [Deltaproteobacteria bacterium]